MTVGRRSCPIDDAVATSSLFKGAHTDCRLISFEYSNYVADGFGIYTPTDRASTQGSAGSGISNAFQSGDSFSAKVCTNLNARACEEWSLIPCVKSVKGNVPKRR